MGRALCVGLGCVTIPPLPPRVRFATLGFVIKPLRGKGGGVFLPQVRFATHPKAQGREAHPGLALRYKRRWRNDRNGILSRRDYIPKPRVAKRTLGEGERQLGWRTANRWRTATGPLPQRGCITRPSDGYATRRGKAIGGTLRGKCLCLT